MRNKIQQLLADLRLKGIAQTLDQQLDMADKKGSSVSEVVYRLLMEEHKYRQERSLEYRIKSAKMPLDWTLKTFPFERQPAVRKHQIQSLAELSFIERAENIVFIGNPGTGKTGSVYCTKPWLPDTEAGFIMHRISWTSCTHPWQTEPPQSSSKSYSIMTYF